jgi:hypothetical protein
MNYRGAGDVGPGGGRVVLATRIRGGRLSIVYLAELVGMGS